MAQDAQEAYMTMTQLAPDPETGLSDIASFYSGSIILITGASGFMGKLLVEKISRSCPDFAQMYLLFRAKKGKSAKTRFDEYFEDSVFDILKREQPRFASKVTMLEGDIGEIDLGISPGNRELLRQTNIVIHAAATVRFDEKLRKAVNINVRGTKELLVFAKEMKDLKAFVYVSTAYSQCQLKVIDEKFYPPPMDTEKLISLVDTLDDSALDIITPKLLGKWPNTYTFTKAVAEDSVRNFRGEIPLCIVRPSIIIATSKEPISGWINNIYGATGICIGAGIGLLRTLHCDENIVADIIPADYVVNLIIAAAWGVAKAKSFNRNTSGSIPKLDDDEMNDSRIYNCVSSCQKPITWGLFTKLNSTYGMKNAPTTLVMWYYCFTLNKHLWLHKIYAFFLHLIPAVIVDSLAYISGREPILWNAYKKIDKFSTMLSFFAVQQWRFHNKSVLALWGEMNPVDRSRFDFNLESLDWDAYLYNHMRGLRVYILKDPMETLPEGKARYAKLKIAHYTIVTVILGLLLWGVAAFLRILGLW